MTTHASQVTELLIILVKWCQSSDLTFLIIFRIASANFPLGHFTHIFVDEASQATEPETLVTLANLLDVNKGGQLVLAGDPKQLGPILRSPLARKHELGKV